MTDKLSEVLADALMRRYPHCVARAVSTHGIELRLGGEVVSEAYVSYGTSQVGVYLARDQEYRFGPHSTKYIVDLTDPDSIDQFLDLMMPE